MLHSIQNIIDGVSIDLTEDQYQALINMGWSEDRYVNIDDKIQEVLDDGGNPSNFAIKLGQRFEGLVRRITRLNGEGFSSDRVEFQFGSAAEFYLEDYQIFETNSLLNMCPIGNFMMYGVLFIDKDNRLYDWFDWHHFRCFGSFEEFIRGMLDDTYQMKEIRIHHSSELPHLW